MRKIFFSALIIFTSTSFAQNIMTPDLLWKLGRVSFLGLSKDKQFILFDVSTPDVDSNKFNHQAYKIPVTGGEVVPVAKADSFLVNTKVSPDGKYLISTEDVKLMSVYGSDFYPELTQTTAQIYTSLMYRHWDTYEDGKFSHVFLSDNDGAHSNKKDLMKD